MTATLAAEQEVRRGGQAAAREKDQGGRGETREIRGREGQRWREGSRESLETEERTERKRGERDRGER